MNTKDSRDMRVRHLAITMGTSLLMCLLIGCSQSAMESGRGAAPEGARASATWMPGAEASVGHIKIQYAHAGESGVREGTGFLIASNLVVTCLHAVNGASSAEITFPSGLSMPVTGISAEDAENDLAILTITPTGAEPPPLPLAPVPAQVGDKLVVHGYPVGPSQKVCGGNVTCIGPSYGMPLAIITSAPLTHGFSGGPALNDQRQVVGVAMLSRPGWVYEGKEIMKKKGIVVHASHITSLAVGQSRSLKDWAEARGAIASALEEVIYGTRAVVEQGDEVKGLQHFQKATQLDPNNFMAWFKLGGSFQGMGRYEESMDALGKALALKPKFPEALILMCRYHVWQDQYPEATEILERILRMNPDSVLGHYQLGLVYVLVGQSEKAREQYRTLKPINP